MHHNKAPSYSINDTITTVITTMPPSTPKKRQLTRDQRLRIQTLREIGWETDAIHAHFRSTIANLSLYQVEYACKFTHPTPRKRSGRPPLLDKEQEAQLIDTMHQRCIDVLDAQGMHTKW